MESDKKIEPVGFTSAQCVEIVLRRAASLADEAEKHMSLTKCYAALNELNRLTGEWSKIIRLAARDMEEKLSKIDTFSEAFETTGDALFFIRQMIKCYESGRVRVGIDEISADQLIDDMAKEEKAKSENQPATEKRTAAKDKYMTAEIMCSLGKLYELQGRYAEAEEMHKNALDIRVNEIRKMLRESARFWRSAESCLSNVQLSRFPLPKMQTAGGYNSKQHLDVRNR